MKQLNKIFTIVTVLLILLLAASLLYTDKVILKPKPPERLNKIPKQAVWVGGVDGGCWIQIIKTIAPNKFKLVIYNDFSGEIIKNATFILNPDCFYKKLDSVSLVKSFVGFDGNDILLRIQEKGKLCSLISKDEN